MLKRLEPSTILHDRYRIVRHIKTGNMVELYEAHDLNLERRVLLEEVSEDDLPWNIAFLDFYSVFERWARDWRELDHLFFPHLQDYFIDRASFFFVVEYVEGQYLDDLMKERNAPFPVEQVLKWADQLLNSTLSAKTNEPILYRIRSATFLINLGKLFDFKNFKLTPDGRLRRAHVDFAIITDRGKSELFSLSGASNYIPPEYYDEGSYFRLWYHDEESYQQTLIYSLGATLYCLLTNAESPYALTRLRARDDNRADPLRPANKLNPKVPIAVADVLMRALELEPTKRPSANEIFDVLRRTQAHLQSRASDKDKAPHQFCLYNFILIFCCIILSIILTIPIISYSMLGIADTSTPRPEAWIEANWWIPALAVMLVLAYTLAISTNRRERRGRRNVQGGLSRLGRPSRLGRKGFERVYHHRPMFPPTKQGSIPKTPPLDTTIDHPMTEAFARAGIEGVEDGEPLEIDVLYKLLAGILREIPEGVTVQRFDLLDVEEVEMDVVVRASGFEISPTWHQRVKVIRGQDSDLLEFILVPKETGEKKIEVEFLYKRHWLTAIVLDVTVVASDGGGV